MMHEEPVYEQLATIGSGSLRPVSWRRMVATSCRSTAGRWLSCATKIGCTPSTIAARTWVFLSTAAASAMEFSPATGTTRGSTCATGGTFDQWADDVRPFRSKSATTKSGSTSPRGPIRDEHHLERLQVGLQRNIPARDRQGQCCGFWRTIRGPSSLSQIGLEFGTRYRRRAGGRG